MTGREKFLLGIFGALLAFFLLLFVIPPLTIIPDQDVTLLSSQLEELPRVEAPLDELAEKNRILGEKVREKSLRFYSVSEEESLDFGLEIRSILKKSGISILQYQNGNEPRQMEFRIEGDPPQIFSFLEKVEAHEKYWSIPYLNLQMQGNRMQGILRIRYEVLD